MRSEPYRLFYHWRVGVVYAVVMLGSMGLGALVASSPLLPSAWVSSSYAAADEATGAATASPPSLTIPELQDRSYPSAPLVVDHDYGRQPGGYDLQQIQYDSDGSTVYAQLAIPGTPPPAGGYPVVVYAHGTVNPPSDYQQTAPTVLNFMGYYTSRGIEVAKPDFRGYGKSGGTTESDYYTSDDTVDVLNLLSSLQLNPQVNSAALGVFGWSQGGEVALKAAVVDPEIKAVVVLAGVNATMTQLAQHPPHSEASGAYSAQPAKNLFNKYGMPTTGSPFWHQMAAVNYLEQLQAAVSLYHCADDVQVPKAYSDALYARLRAAGKSVTYDQCASGGHGFTGSANAGILPQTASFFQREL